MIFMFIWSILTFSTALSRTAVIKVIRVNSKQPQLLEWPLHEEEFVITLDKDGWNLGSVQGYKVDADEIEVQLLEPLKTRAKDDQGKTY